MPRSTLNTSKFHSTTCQVLIKASNTNILQQGWRIVWAQWTRSSSVLTLRANFGKQVGQLTCQSPGVIETRARPNLGWSFTDHLNHGKKQWRSRKNMTFTNTLSSVSGLFLLFSLPRLVNSSQPCNFNYDKPHAAIELFLSLIAERMCVEFPLGW